MENSWISKTISNDLKIDIPDRLFFRIGDVAEIVDVKPYVLRFWETEFTDISPDKSSSGQRVYRRSDVESLLLIKHLLYKERFSIEGARKKIRDLKRGGSLKDFKKEKVMGKADLPKEKKDTLREVKKLTFDIQRICKTPIRDLFRY